VCPAAEADGKATARLSPDVAPHHRGSVRTEHDGERVPQIDVGNVCPTVEDVRTVEHPKRLMACGGHRQIVAFDWLPVER
jgi:hypothetical protein